VFTFAILIDYAPLSLLIAVGSDRREPSAQCRIAASAAHSSGDHLEHLSAGRFPRRSFAASLAVLVEASALQSEASQIRERRLQDHCRGTNSCC
jgi:hypothetical protein